MRRRAWAAGAAVTMTACGLLAGPAGAATRLVGPGHPYAKPCQAFAAAAPGDTIQIDAAGNGGYDGDVCAIGVANLTIEGIHGRARIDAAGRSSGGKAIWVISGANTVVRHVELSGATVPDRNGAGIRVEGDGDLTLVDGYLHDNEDGILTGPGAGTDIVIENSEFARNGAGDGQSHNLYIGGVHSFTLHGSWSHDARVGHLVKSRAQINTIVGNRLTGEGGTGSYELDLPNGGLARVVGNVIEQGKDTQNSSMLAYGEEGATTPSSQLTVVNNTFVNDRPAGGTAIFVGGSVSSPAAVANNLSVGQTTFVTQPTARLTANCLTADPRFVDRAQFDYHLRADSPCRDAGAADAPGGLPDQQYVYDLGTQPRAIVGAAPDAGAFEWGLPAPGSAAGLKVLARRVRADGRIVLTVSASAPGALTARAAARTRPRVVYARATGRARTAGATVTLTLRPTAAGRRALRRRGRLALTVTVALRPVAGHATTRTIRLTLRRSGAGIRRG